jgi:hypothetical protein
MARDIFVHCFITPGLWISSPDCVLILLSLPSLPRIKELTKLLPKPSALVKIFMGKRSAADGVASAATQQTNKAARRQAFVGRGVRIRFGKDC